MKTYLRNSSVKGVSPPPPLFVKSILLSTKLKDKGGTSPPLPLTDLTPLPFTDGFRKNVFETLPYVIGNSLNEKVRCVYFSSVTTL